MVRNAGEFVECVEQAAQMGGGPEMRVLVRCGDFGPEFSVEHVKVRNGRFGLELIIQTPMQPNAS